MGNHAQKSRIHRAPSLITMSRSAWSNGLDGPAGEWLGVLGGHEYMPATLDKCLAELGLLDLGNAMWLRHAWQWSRVTNSWSAPGPGWLQSVLYVDATADPHRARSCWLRTLSGPMASTGSTQMRGSVLSARRMLAPARERSAAPPNQPRATRRRCSSGALTLAAATGPH